MLRHSAPAFSTRIRAMSDSSESGSVCEDVMARLNEHLDGELSPSLDTWVREHLAVCEHCLARTQHQRAFLRTLRTRRPLTPATDALRVRIERRLRSRSDRSERDD